LKKLDWDRLTQDQQRVYEEKASFLLERGYIAGKNRTQLAKEIYEKTG